MKIIILEQENKEDIYVHHCVTCMWVGHKGSQFTRPNCIKLYGRNDNCFQICTDCLKLVVNKLEISEKDRRNRK